MDGIEIFLNEETMQTPNELANMIIQMAEDIDSCKNDLTQIKERGWFKRLTNKHHRDSIEIQIKQNNLMSTFLVIMQMLISVNFNNTVFLGALYEQLCDEEELRGKFCSNYLNIAKDFISATYASSKKHIKRIEDLEGIASSLVQKYNEKEQIDQEQNYRLREIDVSMSKKSVLDDEQSKAIKNIVQYLRKNDEVDHKQTSDIIDLRKRIADVESLAGNNKYHSRLLIYAAIVMSLTAIILSIAAVLK